jgi:uncharacterized delta-60 repeat protein
MAIQSDGRILVVGSAGEPPRFAIARYLPSGPLDPTFGSGGKLVFTARGWGVARAVALQPNGRIVVAGYHSWGTLLVRLLPDGRRDYSFGHKGVVARSAMTSFPLAVAIRRDGRIVVGGDDDIFRFGVARYTRHGDLDPTFGNDGFVSTDVGDGEQAVESLVLQPGGKIVAVGYAGPHEFSDPYPFRFALVRYRAHGGLDRTFGGDGIVITHFNGGGMATGADQDAGGRIVAVGGGGPSNAGAFVLARYMG